jgi:hypothetical protein
MCNDPGGKLLEGVYDERKNEAEFRKAVDEWRSEQAAAGGKSKAH